MTISKETQQLLTQFPRESIKTRKGAGNMKLSYISQGDCTMRLLECWDNGWQFRIVKDGVHKIGDEVVLQCELESPDGKVRQQFGSAKIRRGQEAGDAFKSATSDALKKCASLFGVALHLYGVDVD